MGSMQQSQELFPRQQLTFHLPARRWCAENSHNEPWHLSLYLATNALQEITRDAIRKLQTQWVFRLVTVIPQCSSNLVQIRATYSSENWQETEWGFHYAFNSLPGFLAAKRFLGKSSTACLPPRSWQVQALTQDSPLHFCNKSQTKFPSTKGKQQ